MKSKNKTIHNPLHQLLENKPTIQKPASQTWDELEDYYTTIGLAMAQLVRAAGDSIDVMLSLGYGGDAELKTTYHTLVKDCTVTFTERLLNLREQHKGKTGPAQDGKELAVILGLAQDYQVFYSQYTTVILPQILIITEHMDKAQLLYAQSKVSETDPAVVTDVAYKEVVSKPTTDEKSE